LWGCIAARPISPFPPGLARAQLAAIKTAHL
jgi:hypothetical protein